MATYTVELKDILQEHANNYDDWTPNVMAHYCKETLFMPEALEMIKPEYRDHFAASFGYHYFSREIGQETFGLFRFKLNGRIYENYAYINNIYETSLRPIFSEYKITKRKGKIVDDGEYTRNIVNDQDRIIENNGDVDATSHLEQTGDAKTINDLQNKSIYDSRQEQRGNDINKGTGSVTDERRGKDTQKDTGDTTNEHRGFDTMENRGHDLSEHRGSDTAQHRGYDESSQEGKEIDRLNEMRIHSDTPMGDIDNMHSPRGNAEGQGVGYATGENDEWNYMSDADEHDASTVREFVDRKSVSDYNSDNETIYNSDQKSIYNSDQKSLYNSDQKQVDNRTSEQIYNSDNRQIRDTEDQTIYNSDTFRKGEDTEKSTGSQTNERNLKDDGTSHEEHNDITTDHYDKSHDEDGTKDNIRDITDDIDGYSLNYEMLLKAESVLNKLWNIFDTLFMGIL